MASFLPFSLGEDIARGAVDFDTNSFKLMLVTSSYTPLQTHKKRSDITNEVSGTGYTAGGQATVCTVNRATDNATTTITFGNVTWASPVDSFTARRGWIYRDRGGASSADELVCCLDFGAGVAANGTSYTVTISGSIGLTIPTGV